MQLTWPYYLVYEVLRSGTTNEPIPDPPTRLPVLANAPTVAMPPPVLQLPGPHIQPGGGAGASLP